MEEEEIKPIEEKSIFRGVFDGLRDYHNKVGKLPSREYVPMVCVGQLMLALRKQGLVIKKAE